MPSNKPDAPTMATALTDSLPGQNHERLDPKDELRIRNRIPAEEDVAGGGEPADITPFQKMLSATTGSLITGLTSMQLILWTYARNNRLIAGSDTT